MIQIKVEWKRVLPIGWNLLLTAWLFAASVLLMEAWTEGKEMKFELKCGYLKPAGGEIFFSILNERVIAVGDNHTTEKVRIAGSISNTAPCWALTEE